MATTHGVVNVHSVVLPDSKPSPKIRLTGLRDPGDDLVLEIAVASASRSIVTYNKRDFTAAERFGVTVLDPAEFLREIGEA